MRWGMFMQSSHPPERAMADAIEQDLTTIEWCDELGAAEVWLGEHLTAPWEPIPAMDLVLAQAIPRTERITLCAGAYVLPFYHPGALALRIAQLDHMARGRFMCGIAAGSVPTDFAMTDVDGMSGANRSMMHESFEIMKKLWTERDSEWEYVGKYWTVRNPAPFLGYGPHVAPYQQPHPPIGVAGLSPRSETIRWAGEQGAIPLSLTFSTSYLKGHWEMVEEGAAAASRACDRSDWRVIRTIFVADTDAAARAWVRDGLHARHWMESNFPLLRAFDWVRYLKHDPEFPTATVDVDYLIDHLWLVGSPETVAEKVRETEAVLGGFGTLIVNKYDYGDDPEAYRRSLQLLADEVMPAVTRGGIGSSRS
jgi:alkanesulfonate monooxygenase SsuD/methylene tetrahydromethanopterin reductase-like flavin-dependent oxidoreductase (luciferase family)